MKKYEQRANCPHVLYVKPYNKGFIIPLTAPFSSSLVFSFQIQPALPENCIDLIKARARDENNENEISQTPSKVSEFDRDQKVVALLLIEMLKIKCNGVNKSKFGSLSSAILFLCSVPSVFALF